MRNGVSVPRAPRLAAPLAVLSVVPLLVVGVVGVVVVYAGGACNRSSPHTPQPASPPASDAERAASAPTAADAPAPGSDPRTGGSDATVRARERMVSEQLIARGIRDPQVLAAMRRVPRHEFVPLEERPDAYGDYPLPIGEGQTISQPYVVAAMTELARIGPRSRVLEIGTGSGYQAAVLAAIGAEVYSIEIVPALAARAAATLRRLGYRVHSRQGDGYRGWPDAAPFDAILVTAAPPRVPAPLRAQLRVGGRMIIPVGKTAQELRVVERTASGWEERRVFPVQFVPMTGEAQERRHRRDGRGDAAPPFP